MLVRLPLCLFSLLSLSLSHTCTYICSSRFAQITRHTCTHIDSIAEPLQSMIQQGHFGKNTTVDGGFYTQTPDNTPLIGRVQKDLKTVLTISGLSGYGIMMSCGAADLLCCEIVSSDNDNDDTKCNYKKTNIKDLLNYSILKIYK